MDADAVFQNGYGWTNELTCTTKDRSVLDAEMSASTAALLQKYGFQYDHSQGYRDFQPFYARVGDSWNVIDYAKKAEEWMKPLTHGKEIDLIRSRAVLAISRYWVSVSSR